MHKKVNQLLIANLVFAFGEEFVAIAAVARAPDRLGAAAWRLNR